MSALVLLAALGLMAGYWLNEGYTPAKPAPASTGSAIGSADIETPTLASGIDTDISTDTRLGASDSTATDVALPLPAVDASLDAVINELLPRAEAGEARAACRLAFELLRCESLRKQKGRMFGFMLENERRTEAQGQVEIANSWAEDQLEVHEASAACRHVPQDVASRGSDFLYAAARSGHGESMLRYIMGDALAFVPGINGESRAAEFLAHPEFDRWYREAPLMAEQMLARGDVGALYLLALAYGGDSYDLFSARIADDPVQYQAYLSVLDRINGRPPRVVEGLSATQSAQARELSARLIAGPFATARVDRHPLAGLMPPGASHKHEDVARCD